ncbi:hypothetical protein Val02_82170 [Virgisporangium aliadipatigenens]|uniref:Uncharacterized protein n=1 Tax=Virgisporangium aliadipatigenens TaxID=741659 RepID=A0A8J3YTN2_9ACTN|nr:hypothetical protein [Virgisporangium aliadipatigenens]GIJ51331.1 hypothetical protein Val02_82170 [Virgisporangium aliadipatigenens]
MDLGTVGAVSAIGAACCAIGAGLIAGGRVAWRILANTVRTRDAILGTPASGDEPARPGIVGRLSVVEQRLASLESQSRQIKAEVTPNGGGSLKDAVGRIDRRTQAVDELLGAHIRQHNGGAVDPTVRLIHPDRQRG